MHLYNLFLLKFKYLTLLLNRASDNLFMLSVGKFPKFKSLRLKSWRVVDFYNNLINFSTSSLLIGAQEDRSNTSILLKYSANDFTTVGNISGFPWKSNSLKLNDVN